MTRVLVLNASYEPINVTTVKRAVVLLLKEKAEVVETGEAVLHAETTTLPSPVVIRLITYVRIPFSARKRITRRALFARDDWACLYCGSTTNLTVDHVIPRARGGEHAWTNLATCCAPCNRRKGHADLRDVGMKLRHQPSAPPRDVFVFVMSRVPPSAWRQYLGY